MNWTNQNITKQVVFLRPHLGYLRVKYLKSLHAEARIIRIFKTDFHAQTISYINDVTVTTPVSLHKAHQRLLPRFVAVTTKRIAQCPTFSSKAVEYLKMLPTSGQSVDSALPGRNDFLSLPQLRGLQRNDKVMNPQPLGFADPRCDHAGVHLET